MENFALLNSGVGHFAHHSFQRDFSSCRFIRPICLPVLSYAMSKDDFSSKQAIASGWGLHTFSPVAKGHGPYAQRVNKLTGLTVMSNEACQRAWIENGQEYAMTTIVDSMICAKPRTNTSSCYGDSGGKSKFTLFRLWDAEKKLFVSRAFDV